MSDYTERLYIVAVEKDHDPHRQPSLNETYIAYTCKECGAIVRDRAFHDKYHKARKAEIAELWDRIAEGS